MTDCIFCKIINKKINTNPRYEDGDIIAFDDIHPQAPIHVLIIPKQHIPSIAELNDNQYNLAGKLIIVAKKIAEDLGISQDGYKLLFRVKNHGGQEVGHIHLHLIGGAKLHEDIRPA